MNQVTHYDLVVIDGRIAIRVTFLNNGSLTDMEKMERKMNLIRAFYYNPSVIKYYSETQTLTFVIEDEKTNDVIIIKKNQCLTPKK